MDKFILRRSILKALKEVAPAPIQVDLIMEYIPLAFAGDKRKQVEDEITNLAMYEMIENVNKDSIRTPYYRITKTGMSQINQDSPRLDARIWGPMAL